MSRLLITSFLLIVLVLLVAALLAPRLLDTDKVLQLASTALYEQTGATLTVNGKAELSLFPLLGVSLSDAAVTLPDHQEPDARVRSLDIGIKLLPVLSGRVEMDTVRMDGLVFRTKSATESTTTTRGPAEAANGAEAVFALPLALNVKRLVLTNSRIEQFGPSGAPSTVLELVNLQATNLNTAQEPGSITLQLRLPGEPSIDIAMEGTVRIDPQAQQIHLEEVTTAITGATAQPVTLLASGTLDLAQELADLQISLESGEARATGSLVYANRNSPKISTHLQMNVFDPALLALAGPDAAATAQEKVDMGSEDKPLPLDTLRLVDTSAELSIEEARFGTHTVKNLQVKLRALAGVVEVSDMTGDLHGGQLTAKALFNGKQNAATFETSGSVTGLDIATALAAAEKEPVLTGSATMDWQLRSQGRTERELMASLNGPLGLTTEDVTLQGTSVEKLLCQAVALTNQETLTTTFPSHTRFDMLTADVQLANGSATLSPLRAELPQVALTGEGNLDLETQNFDSLFKARLAPELEELDHACRISKRLTAIDWPVICKGNTATDSASWCSVDTAKIVQDLTISEGREKLEKKAGKLLNKLFNRGD